MVFSPPARDSGDLCVDAGQEARPAAEPFSKYACSRDDCGAVELLEVLCERCKRQFCLACVCGFAVACALGAALRTG